MKPLICPQCGGKITDYKPRDNFAVCGYCETRFVIETEKPKPFVAPLPDEPVYESFETSTPNQTIITIVIGTVLLFIVGIFLIAIGVSKKKSTSDYTARAASPYQYSTATPTPVSTPSPNNLNLLEFGGKGSSIGAFVDASAIAVDSKGRIYVGDNSLRVQQFDDKGNFLQLWQIPAQTEHYRRARTIQKIAVDNKDRLYVLVGGVLQMWEQNTIELPEMTYHAAPDFMVDFAVRADGGLLLVSINDDIETLIYLAKNGKVTRKINGFHTDTADAAMSPAETGLEAIRLAVDGAGNIFSIYALGDLGSYQLSYNEEDFRIFRFTPEGKFVDKFARTMNSVGIAVDNQSRVYISDKNAIYIYSKTGEQVSAVADFQGGINAFALDRKNFVYVLIDDKVVKRSALN